MKMLSGLDTEYGLHIAGRGAETQIEDSMALVGAYADECFVGWDYRYESPRSDLRGFSLSHLTEDPIDAQFDRGKKRGEPHEVRADRILANGSRFYNDHGHPEYATPEARSIHVLASYDQTGDAIVRSAALSLEQEIGAKVVVYKNNTDFHGASWGSHESYLVPRTVGFEKLYNALLPMMAIRPVLVGAGKVGSESEQASNYQISQRADFFAEPVNAETLYRRPIFNTRDEPHADRSDWIRLHVICGDSNMIASATARKLGLIRLGIKLCIEGTAPRWSLRDPVRAAQSISRDPAFKFDVELEGKSWTNAEEMFESYFSAAEATLDLDEEDRWTIDTSRALLHDLRRDWKHFCFRVDWAAKRSVLEQANLAWDDPTLRAYDLEYHNLDPDAGLHAALLQMGAVEPNVRKVPNEFTRAYVRGLAVSKYRSHIITASWRSLVFNIGGHPLEIELLPDAVYSPDLENTANVEEFVERLRSIK